MDALEYLELQRINALKRNYNTEESEFFEFEIPVIIRSDRVFGSELSDIILEIQFMADILNNDIEGKDFDDLAMNSIAILSQKYLNIINGEIK